MAGEKMGKILVIGAGAAGMMAAIAAASGHERVTLIEKNEKTGKKLFITGKGRCNVTNACDTQGLFSNVMEHSKFLYSAIYGFDNVRVMDFFENKGCRLKVERGLRVFPYSDHSSDIIRTLEKEMDRLGIEVMLNNEVKEIITEDIEDIEENIDSKEDNLENIAHELALLIDRNEKKDKYESRNDKKTGKGLVHQKKVCACKVLDLKTGQTKLMKTDRIIVATGGISYPLTGSTGDGYRLAGECGHSVSALMPALVPFGIKEKWCGRLQGLSLKNVQLTLYCDKSRIYSDFGEMLFTHYGVSGPLVLSASSHYVHYIKKMIKKNKIKDYSDVKTEISIDLKPALSKEQLDKRVLRDFDENKNKQFRNAISGMFPSKLVPLMPELTGINPEKKVNEVTRQERDNFVSVIKDMRLTVTELRGYDEAVITSGGVEVSQINPSTMESKLVKGLYFAGEVLDVDALTGGFNLQIAWSTGYLAGKSAQDRAKG